ncbi:hypothetical protein P3T73_12405 [Kiritimatiellota bacterium B12222]|nr:hypothetical protein P3T73_12405 [Kiritimatiellota bacterium B12222]
MNLKKILIVLFALTYSCISFASDIEIEFRQTDYFHRWSKNNQHEFTPKDQEDLSKWKDMLTVNFYPEVKSGEDLAGIANNVLGLYQQHGAMVLRVNSIPRTDDKEAEHLIAVLFSQKDFIEIVFTRIAMTKSDACSIVYSHRIYGSKAGDEASVWLQKNGENSEKALMNLTLSEVLPMAREGANKTRHSTPEAAPLP